MIVTPVDSKRSQKVDPEISFWVVAANVTDGKPPTKSDPVKLKVPLVVSVAAAAKLKSLEGNLSLKIGTKESMK